MCSCSKIVNFAKKLTKQAFAATENFMDQTEKYKGIIRWAAWFRFQSQFKNGVELQLYYNKIKIFCLRKCNEIELFLLDNDCKTIFTDAYLTLALDHSPQNVNIWLSSATHFTMFAKNNLLPKLI